MNELFNDPLHLIFLPIAALFALFVLTVVIVGLTAFVEQVFDWWVAHNIRRAALAKARLDLALVPPDANGLMSLARELVASGDLTEPLLKNQRLHVKAKRAVPNTIHIVTNDDRQVAVNHVPVGATGGGAFNLLDATAQDKRFVALPDSATMPVMQEAEVTTDATN